MRRSIVLLITILVLIPIILMGCSGTEGKANKEKDTFKVGLEAGYPPFNWTQMNDSNGGVKIHGGSEYAGGYDVEIAKKIAEGLGKELVIVKIDWDGMLPAIQSGVVDGIIAGMSPTKKRMESIDFSDVYYKSDLVMVVKKGSEYENSTSIQDFNGAKITAQLGTFHYSVIDQIHGVIKEAEMSDFAAMRVALESGIIDGYVSERPEAISASSANENYVMVEFEDGFQASVDDTAVAVGLKKGSELKGKIDKILKEVSEKERENIMDKAILNQPTMQ